MPNPIISVQGLDWEVGERKILDQIFWDVYPEENWVLLGKNGSGKTSLINFLFGYHWPTRGEISLLGKKFGEHPIRKIQRHIGILEAGHQESRLQRNLTISDILRTGLLNSIGIYSELDIEGEEKVAKIIEENSWIQNPEQRFDTLSSGEKKKVLLLRALISPPQILILDEPCSSLDIHSREDFFIFLEQYRKSQNFTSILITHRVDEIPDYFSHAFLLKNGKTVFQGKLEQAFTEENLSETYELPIRLVKDNGNYFAYPKRK